MSKKKTTEEFIQRAREVHGDKYDYSKVEYINAKTKVCIICPEHGKFWQKPDLHLDGCGCSHCVGLGLRRPRGYWSYETCFDLAKKCKTRSEMKAISNHAYSLARKNKWFDDYIWMTSKDKKPIGYWNDYEHCRKEAKKYSSISEFQQKCYTGARYSSKNGWMGDFFKPKYKPRGYWNDYKKCKELAETCKTISEFSKKSSSAYYWSRINNWLEGFEWLVDQSIYNDNKIDCVYAYEFTEYNSAYIGRTLIRRIKKRDKEHHTSMYVDKKGVIHYTSDAVASFANEKNCNIPIMKILETNLTLKEGKIKEDEYRKFYEINGWTILNKAKTGKNSSSVGSLGKGKWDPKNVKEIALTCKSRSEFKRINGSAYETARKNGWLNDYTWFVSPQKPKDYWNIFDNIEKEAKKYKSRWDFGKHNGSAYEAARRNGWINKLFPQKEKFNEEEK